MRSVLVCVRTPSAAQAVSTAAKRLGLAELISTVVSGADALARAAQVPPDVLLVDTSSVRPDTVGFTRRVLEYSPGAVLVFFGPEDSVVAERAVAAGARGLIRGGDDLTASVAKALMLLLRPRVADEPSAGVPLQRSELGEAEDADGAAVSAAPTPGPSSGSAPAAATSVATASPATVAASSARTTDTVTVSLSNADTRRIALTEREMQVLCGMAEGRSNAEIGRELFVSEDTVKTHARRLFRKLGARDRAHAVAEAFRAGIVH